MHQVFSFRHSYFGLWVDGMNVVLDACTIENEEAVRGIRSSERLGL